MCVFFRFLSRTRVGSGRHEVRRSPSSRGAESSSAAAPQTQRADDETGAAETAAAAARDGKTSDTQYCSYTLTTSGGTL